MQRLSFDKLETTGDVTHLLDNKGGGLHGMSLKVFAWQPNQPLGMTSAASSAFSSFKKTPLEGHKYIYAQYIYMHSLARKFRFTCVHRSLLLLSSSLLGGRGKGCRGRGIATHSPPPLVSWRPARWFSSQLSTSLTLHMCCLLSRTRKLLVRNMPQYAFPRF